MLMPDLVLQPAPHGVYGALVFLDEQTLIVFHLEHEDLRALRADGRRHVRLHVHQHLYLAWRKKRHRYKKDA